MLAHSNGYSKIPEQQKLLDYEVDNDGVRKHLKWGIQYAAAQKFVDKMLPNNNVNKMRAMMKNDEDYDPKDGDWISAAYPDELTGYDLLVAIKCWLRKENRENKSVCMAFDHCQKSGVGKADVFISHCQSERPQRTLDLMSQVDRRMGSLAVTEKIHSFQWVDYFALRQSHKRGDFEKGEFEAVEIYKLIKSIGTTIARPDEEYFSRSFCILEIFATIDNEKKLLFPVINPIKSSFQVKSEDAKSKDPEGKKLVDEFIREKCGFEKLDKTLQKELSRTRRMLWKARCNKCIYWGVVLLLTVPAIAAMFTVDPFAGAGVFLLISFIFFSIQCWGNCLNRCGVRPSRNWCLTCHILATATTGSCCCGTLQYA